jgi:hypothetical protein
MDKNRATILLSLFSSSLVLIYFVRDISMELHVIKNDASLTVKFYRDLNFLR